MGPELVIAGWFSSPVVRQLIDYISKLPVWLKKKDELMKLETALQRIQAVVETVEDLQIIDNVKPGLKAWFWRLKDAMEEASNVLDELEYYRLKEIVKSGGPKVNATVPLLSKHLSFLSKHEVRLKSKMNGAVKKLHEVADHHKDFLQLLNLLNPHGARQQQFVDRNSGHLLIEDKVFGREKEEEDIVAWLKKSEGSEHESSVKNVTVLPIVGAGGMGKTTLAQLVYKDVENNFDLQMWVCVSNNFNVTDIMKKIVVAATGTNPPNEEWSTLQNILTKNLQSKRFLLVLDDVWNDNERQKWENLMAPLKKGKKGSKILLTTRMDSVAKMIQNVMMEETEEPMNLQGIEWNDYLLLFNKHAFAGVNPNDNETLQPVGCQIAKNLGGSPLVAKVVGGMLNSKLSVEFWNEVLKDGVFNSIRDHKDFKPILRLSYFNLPQNLQSCFRFCCIFPQGYGFEKNDVIHMWMAAGLIQQSEDVKGRPEDIGGQYFDNLLQKSFFGCADVCWSDERYTIHDLLHEVACSVSKDECLGVFLGQEARDFQFPTTLRHLCIVARNPLLLDKIPQPENLHTLILETVSLYDGRDDAVCDVLKRLKNLRVLKLGLDTPLNLVTIKHTPPKAIGHLKHLRYLDLKVADIIWLFKPVSKLYHLQTLNIICGNTYTENICEGMNSLINLRHMKIFPPQAVIIPKIGELISLQELHTFYVQAKKGYKISELKHLMELRYDLSIIHLENIRSYEEAKEAELHDKVHLHKIQLHWDSNCSPEIAAEVIDGLRPYSGIKDLEIIGYGGGRPPCWLETKDDLTKLESITLCNCEGLNFLPPLEQLPYLKFLSLQNMSALTQIDHPLPKYGVSTAFPKLEVLELQSLPQWKKWYGAQDGRWFPCLKSLTIKYCSMLTALPPLPYSLEQLNVHDVGLTILPKLWQCQNNDCESSRPPNLRLLNIGFCHRLMSLAEGLFEHADHFVAFEELSISSCKKLVHVPGDMLQKLTSLRRLRIFDCRALQRPNVAHDDFCLPSSVQEISMIGCGEMDASLLGAMQHLASLSFLFLEDCTNITSLPSAEVFRRFTALKELHILVAQS